MWYHCLVLCDVICGDLRPHCVQSGEALLRNICRAKSLQTHNLGSMISAPKTTFLHMLHPCKWFPFLLQKE